MIPVPSPLQRFRSAASRAFVFDFDGTLSEIVARPEMARAVSGAAGALSKLAEANPLVAVVSGRAAGQLRELIGVPGVTLVGLYGLPDSGPEQSRLEAARKDIARAIELVPGSWLEDKGPTLAVHYRAARDPAEAERVLLTNLRTVATGRGLSLLAGKMVLELAGGEVPGKGAVVRELVQSARVSGCFYAGDDVADLEAFRALDELDAVAAVRVAVRSEETPERLIAAADLVVDRPAGLVRLLSEL